MRALERTSRSWLDTARKDLEFARLAASSDFHAHACFNAHQAAEKAVKAIHYAKGARTVLGNSVRQLLEHLDIASLRMLHPAARQLDLYYVPTRYPTGLDNGTPDEAFSADQSDQALDFARDIVTAAANIVAETTGDRQD